MSHFSQRFSPHALFAFLQFLVLVGIAAPIDRSERPLSMAIGICASGALLGWMSFWAHRFGPLKWKYWSAIVAGCAAIQFWFLLIAIQLGWNGTFDPMIGVLQILIFCFWGLGMCSLMLWGARNSLIISPEGIAQASVLFASVCIVIIYAILVTHGFVPTTGVAGASIPLSVFGFMLAVPALTLFLNKPTPSAV